MAAIGVVQPAFGRIVVEQGLSDAFRVSYHPDVYYHQLVEFRVYCYACRQTLLTSSSNPATFNLKALEDQDHPGPFEITAIVSGTKPPSPSYPYSIKVVTSSIPAEAGATNYQGGALVYEGTYGGSQPITLQASQFSGYIFSYWRNDVSGRNVSSNPTFSFTGTCDDDYPNVLYRFTAVFRTRELKHITVDVCDGSEGLGTVAGSGEYLEGATADISASESSGNLFIGWSSEKSDPTKIISRQKSFTITVSGNASYYAVFRQGTLVTIHARPNKTPSSPEDDFSNAKLFAPGYEDGSFDIQVEVGTACCIRPFSNLAHTTFSGWEIDGVVVSTSPIYQFVATRDCTITALFSGYTPPMVIDLEYCNGSNDKGVMTWHGERKWYHSASQGYPVVTFSATPNQGFVFDGWYSDANFSVLLSRSSEQTLRMGAGGDLGATYKWLFYSRFVEAFTLALSAKESANGSDGGGTVSGAGSYAEGVSVTISATPDDGFRFLTWSDGVTDATRTIKITSDLSLTAFFCSDMLMYDPSSGALLYAGNPLLFDGAIHVPPFES